MQSDGVSAFGVMPTYRIPLMTSLVKNKAFAIISRSAKSLGNLLDGNNVTEIIVIRHSVWSALVYYVIEMHLAIGVVYSLLVD